MILGARVVNPDSGFRIQSVSWVSITKNCRKNTAENFLINNCILLIPRPPKRTSKIQEKPSALKREHPVLQNEIY
jgi:hypothetical protein